MINLSQIKYEPFGNCVCISNGSIEIYVTIDFGPRIIRCAFVGGENFMKEDKDFALVNDITDSKFNDNTFYIRGGHRFWISPEAFPRTYYPDNNSVSYAQCGDKVIFTQDEQVANELSLSLEIKMDAQKDEIEINHIAKNTGYWTKVFSMWPITVMADGGTEIIPQNITDTGLLPNRNLVLWSYTNISDSRASFGDKYITLVQNTKADKAFKIGLFQQRPWAAYFHHGDMFVKKYSIDPDGKYPDFGCSYETYTNKSILEMETLSRLVNVMPNESVCHKETWLIYKNVQLPANESAIDELAEEYKLD